MNKDKLKAFLKESNKIESNTSHITERRMVVAEGFLELDVVLIEDIENFVNVFQPGELLRDKEGMDVGVGNHIPIKGGVEVLTKLFGILAKVHAHPGENIYQIHNHYETLHPFTDCNGRSGRILWLWQMLRRGDGLLDIEKWPDLGFLHTWYYQSLQEGR